jgi:hypothetical protein
LAGDGVVVFLIGGEAIPKMMNRREAQALPRALA